MLPYTMTVVWKYTAPCQMLKKDISSVQNKSDMQILWTKEILCPPPHTRRLYDRHDVHGWFNIWAELKVSVSFYKEAESRHVLILSHYKPYANKKVSYMSKMLIFFPLQVYIVLSGNLFWEEIDQQSYNTKWIDWNYFSQLLRHA